MRRIGGSGSEPFRLTMVTAPRACLTGNGTGLVPQAVNGETEWLEAILDKACER